VDGTGSALALAPLKLQILLPAFSVANVPVAWNEMGENDDEKRVDKYLVIQVTIFWFMTRCNDVVGY